MPSNLDLLVLSVLNCSFSFGHSMRPNTESKVGSLTLKEILSDFGDFICPIKNATDFTDLKMVKKCK